MARGLLGADGVYFDSGAEYVEVVPAAAAMLHDGAAHDIGNPQGRFVTTDSMIDPQCRGHGALRAELLQHVHIAGVLLTA